MPRILVALATLLLTFASIPARAQICTPFTDVAASDPFCTNIQWLFNRGVTLGCTATQYCPTNFVRRDQMAAFMNRLADNAVFQQGGNAFGAAGVLGTNDNQPLDVRVNNARVMRYEPNAISPNVIGGSPANIVTAGTRGATIGGGGVAPGADPDYGGEGSNVVAHHYGTVGGGYNNRIQDAGFGPPSFATIGGGSRNLAGGTASTVTGGTDNGAYNLGSTVSGGTSNVASAFHTTVGGGSANQATSFGSTVPGGISNHAAGTYSFAAGYRAKATTKGTFMWADSTDADWVPSVANFFGVRATGGIGMTVAVNAAGAATQFCNYLPGFSGWSCTSDRDAKENFVAANGEDILAKLAAMPLYSWNYKGADVALRMLGPTAQDFDSAFGLGNADKTIASGNLDGVALAAIQGLNAKLEGKLAMKDAEIATLRADLAAMRSVIATIAADRPTQTAEIRP